MQDAEAGDKAQLDRLLRQRKRAGYHRLASNDRCKQRDKHHRQPDHIRDHQEERILDRCGSGSRVHRQDHCSLTHIIEHQGRKHEP